MTNQIDSLDAHAQSLKVGRSTVADFAGFSVGQQLYIALAASNFELLNTTGYTVAGALDRLGTEWTDQLIERWK